uniref:CSON011292 protein n=1 Tax=Culicoides sonorensis TaxID=179676 RepID=A0A336LLX0_CULSO
MVIKWLFVLQLQIYIHVIFVNSETPRVKVSIETNFGDSLKDLDDGTESTNCGISIEDSLPIGRFPWFAKIYVSKFSGITFKCGGSLISNDLILTSAACLKARGDINHPENFIVFLGKSYFLNFKGPVQMRTIRRLIIHPKFNYETHFADLALLRLTEPVERNRYVNPVCVSNTVKKLQGSVPGFEFKENQNYIGRELSSTIMTIVDSKNCTLKHKKVPSVDPQRSSLFCTSYETKQTCRGDDGTGFYFNTGGKWHIGGVNSIGIGWQEKAICDENHFSGFTNISPFLEWIQSYM